MAKAWSKTHFKCFGPLKNARDQSCNAKQVLIECILPPSSFYTPPCISSSKTCKKGKEPQITFKENMRENSEHNFAECKTTRVCVC